MSHSCPKTLLETNGKILSSPEHEYWILDTEFGNKGHDVVVIIGRKHIWFCRHLCPTKTSQFGPDFHGVETMGGVALHD